MVQTFLKLNFSFRIQIATIWLMIITSNLPTNQTPIASGHTTQ